MGLQRAEDLYEKVFFEYGDDSVAQLGGVHLACEQASNLLTKILEWGRLASYLEQSTRYIAYDARLGGRYRYYRDPAILSSPFGTRYVGDLDRLFDTYAQLVEAVQDHVRAVVPKQAGDSDFVYRQATRAKALDAVRGVLPAASTSNVGIYGSGQAFESLLVRLRTHPLPEARTYGELMLHELRKVIPSFLRRVDVAGSGRRLERLPGADPHGHGGRREQAVRRRGAAGRAGGHPGRLGPGRRGQGAGRGLLRRLGPARAADPRPGPAAVGRRAGRAPAGLRGGADEPPAQARPGLRAHRLPLRRARPTTAPSGTCSATGC